MGCFNVGLHRDGAMCTPGRAGHARRRAPRTRARGRRRPEGGQLHEQGGTMGSATGAIAWALLLLSPGRGHAEDSDNLADHHAAASASRTAESDEPAASRPSVSMQCTAGTEKSGSGTTANWPTYHFMNNVTKNASGALLLEPLNDANAIAEYKGALLQHDGGLPLLPPREG